MRPETICHVNYANECEENIEKERRYTMFTGIVEEVGTIDTISRGANSAVLTIRAEKVPREYLKVSSFLSRTLP